MYTRRNFFISSAAVSIAMTSAAKANDACVVFTPDKQKATTPDGALQLLKDGNARFVSGKSVNCDMSAQVRDTAAGQAPFAVVVGCIDSRVPPELVFDQQLGDIFAARIAGNFVNDDIIGSLEFATKVAGAKAIVVLGHTECGAIKGAVDGAKLGLLTKMLENFKPAIEASSGIDGDKSSKNKKLVQAVADMNAQLAAKKLTERSDVLRELVEQKQLLITSAMHDLSTGTVKFF
jgi:carbonic anhydrase